MDIRLRNIRNIPAAKGIAVFLVWLSFAGLFAEAVYWGIHQDFMTKEYYYETYEFQKEFKNKIDSTVGSIEIQKLTQDINEAAGHDAVITSDPAVKNYNYIAINTKTGAVVTNMDINGKYVRKTAEGLGKNKTSFFYSVEGKTHFSNNLQFVIPNNPTDTSVLNDFRSNLDYAPIELYAAVNDQLKAGDAFYDIMNEFKKFKNRNYN